MKKTIIVIAFIVVMFSMTGCVLFSNLFKAKPFVANNVPIDIPEHPLYVLTSCDRGNALVAVINLNNDSIAGIDTVGSETEYIEDFTVGPQGYLFVTVANSSATELSNIIRVIDPASGRLVKDIVLNDYSPGKIIPMPDNRCLVEHTLLAWGDSLFACDILNLNTISVEKTLRLRGMVDNLLRLPVKGDYYLIVYDPLDSVPGVGMENERYYKFDINTGEVSNNYFLSKRDCGILDFINDTTYICEGNMQDNRAYLLYFNFPECEVIDSMLIAESVDDYPSCSIYLKGKYYYGIGNYPYGQKIPGDDMLRVIDPITHTLIKRIKIFSSPSKIYYSHTTDRMYIVNEANPSIFIINPNTDNVVDSIVSNQFGADKWQHGCHSLYIP